MKHKWNLELFSPFEEWGDGYMGLCFQDGLLVTNPDPSKDWKEYHLTYFGGGIWEIDVSDSECTSTMVYRGRIPDRSFFKCLMNNIENPPLVNWEALP